MRRALAVSARIATAGLGSILLSLLLDRYVMPATSGPLVRCAVLGPILSLLYWVTSAALLPRGDVREAFSVLGRVRRGALQRLATLRSAVGVGGH